MWWRPAWFSLKGKGSIRSQRRGAVLPHPALSTNRPADPCTTATLALHARSGFSSVGTYATSGLRAGSTAGRHAGPTRADAEAGLGLWSRNQPLADRHLARGFARPAHGFRFLADLALGRLLVGFALLHLPEDAFPLHLLFEHPECLIDVVVANEYLQRTCPLVRRGKPP